MTSNMYYQAASRIYEAATFVRDGLLGPLYISVTWMLNKILGHFSPYIGLEHKPDYPLMRIYGLPPWEPDCSLLIEWLLVVALVLVFFYSLAITFFILEARRDRHLARFPPQHYYPQPPEEEVPPLSELHAATDDPPEESTEVPLKLENFWHPVEDGLLEVKFVLNGYEKILYVYSEDKNEMEEYLLHGLPEDAVNGVFQYMRKHVLPN